MNRFQFAKVDGHPDWTVGQDSFAGMWPRAYDLLRFHKGKGFRIREKAGAFGPPRHLSAIAEHLGPDVRDSHFDTVFEVRSEADGYSLVFRRHMLTIEKGQLVIEHAKRLIGTPYHFGVTDCSWLTMTCYGGEGVLLPHNAHLQHEDPKVIQIRQSQLKPGDLLFHWGDDHVSLWLDGVGDGRVIDTEPHGTTGPAGWGYLEPGARIRPQTAGYYCDWAHVNGIGRVVAINGAP